MAKKIFDYYKNNELVKDNVLLFAGTMILNLFGFLYHFYLGRALGPKDYGILGVLLAFSYFLNVFLHSLQSAFARFTAFYKAKGKLKWINYMYRRAIRRMFFVGLTAMVLFYLLVPFISDFLHIDDIKLFYLIGFLGILALGLAVTRGVLQGLQKFKVLGLSLTSEGTVKFLGAVILVSLGYSVFGGLAAFVFSFFIGFVVAFFSLLKYWRKDEAEYFDTSQIYKYSFPMISMILFLTAFFSLDIILVKHYFPEFEAGLYSALSILGKILFFGSISISQVMFPKVSDMIAKGQDHRSLFLKSLAILVLMNIPLVLVYFIFPGQIIEVVFGSDYLGLMDVLGWFSVFIFLFGVVYLSSFYIIVQKKYKFIVILFLFNVLEVMGIGMFHESLVQVVYVLISVMSVLMFLLLFKIFRSFGKTYM